MSHDIGTGIVKIILGSTGSFLPDITSFEPIQVCRHPIHHLLISIMCPIRILESLHYRNPIDHLDVPSPV